MRTIKELLILLRDHIIKHGVKTGMCAIILYHFIDINGEEEDALLIYLYDHAPFIEPDFTQLEVFWWKEGLAEPRIDWLNEQINKL